MVFQVSIDDGFPFSSKMNLCHSGLYKTIVTWLVAWFCSVSGCCPGCCAWLDPAPLLSTFCTNLPMTPVIDDTAVRIPVMNALFCILVVASISILFSASLIICVINWVYTKGEERGRGDKTIENLICIRKLSTPVLTHKMHMYNKRTMLFQIDRVFERKKNNFKDKKKGKQSSLSTI